jgi:hypothetical protein
VYVIYLEFSLKALVILRADVAFRSSSIFLKLFVFMLPVCTHINILCFQWVSVVVR